MIRAFVALSIIVLGLLFYAIKGGHWLGPNSPTATLARNDPRSAQDRVNQAKLKSDARIQEIQKKVAAKHVPSDDLGLSDQSANANNNDVRASADIKRVELEDKAAEQKRLDAISKQDKENKALSVATEVRLKKETDDAIQAAKKEAMQTAATQIEAKIADVQAKANEKIEKTQSLLEALKQEKLKLAAKNDELEKIQTEAQRAADTAAAASQTAQLAARKTAEILGSKKVDTAEIVAAISETKPLDTKSSSDVIRTVEDAKRVGEGKSVTTVETKFNTVTSTVTAKVVSKPATNPQQALHKPTSLLQKAPIVENQTAPVASPAKAAKLVSTTKQGAPEKSTAVVKRDPVTGFPVTYGFSIFTDHTATILFSFASNALSDSAVLALTKAFNVAEKLKSNEYVITGFSDGTGTTEAQQSISVARSKSVKDFLLSLGVPENKIISKTSPQAYSHDNTTAEGRMLNRRVEITLQ